MSSNKEPHHFCIDNRYERGAENHNALFERKPNTRYFGESSTGYLPWPIAAERIARDLDHPKAIMILRHPVERCFSHYRWLYRLGFENRGFLEAVKNDGFGYRPDRPSIFGYMAYLEFSQYSQQCPVWERALGRENCLFLASEDLLRDREKTLTRCFDFLSLPPFELSRGWTENKNETDTLGRHPTRAMTYVGRIVPYWLKLTANYRGLKNRILRAVAPTPPVSMTDEERNFVESTLVNDVEWFEAHFPTRKDAA